MSIFSLSCLMRAGRSISVTCHPIRFVIEAKKAFSIGNSIGYGRPATRFKGNIFQAGSSKMGLFLCPARKIFLIIYPAYSVDELLTGLYGHDYRTVLGISGKDVDEKDTIKSDTAAYSESYINIEISRDLKIIVSQLREIADKKAPLDNETAAVLANKITASIDRHNNDTIAENVRLQELIKDLKEAQEENNKEKMQNLLSDSANSATILTALTAFARYAGTLL